jgi:hypothetical protein
MFFFNVFIFYIYYQIVIWRFHAGMVLAKGGRKESSFLSSHPGGEASFPSHSIRRSP